MVRFIIFSVFILSSWNSYASIQCARFFSGLNQSDLREYYGIKTRLDPEAEFQSIDNKNLVGTYYSLIPKVTNYRILKNQKDVINNLKRVFEIPSGSNVGFGSGVRSILKQVFEQFSKEGYQVFLPEDIYPVYQSLAQNASLQVRSFKSIPSLKLPQPSVSHRELLVLTSPLSPTGKSLSKNDIKEILMWLNGHPERRLILDTVYTFQNHFDTPTLQLLKNPKVLVIHSFAKSYLIPGHLGFAVESGHLFSHVIKELNTLDYNLASRAIAIMNSKINLPEVLKLEFKKQWEDLASKIRSVYPEWSVPENGYYSVLPVSSTEILDKLGLWSLPLSSFGSSNQQASVVSALPARREKLYYVSVLSNFSRGFDKYAMTYSKAEISESSFPDKFFLLDASEISIGLNKALAVLRKTMEGDRVVILETSEDVSNLFPNERTGLGRYIRNNKIALESLYYLDENNRLEKVRVEDVYADSLMLNSKNFIPIDQIKPRSISLLPIARACQACCKFCFSEASISLEKRAKGLTREKIERSFAKARASGAERAVITGGGEPTLIGFPKLNEYVEISNQYFPGRVTLITNGLTLAKLNAADILARLEELDRSGLSVLAISRHHQNVEKNQFIMGLDTQTEKVMQVYKDHKNKFKNLKLRLICVLQKTGVSSEQDISEYIDWARENGVQEINFKELYVSTDRESEYALSSYNTYSEQNRVYLKTVLDYANKYGWKKIAELPWGAPIYEKSIKGVRMQIAAYTEPSLFWERTHGVARSWNLMSDGKLMMSLENGDAEISY